MARSLKKGPFVDGHLLKKIDAANAGYDGAELLIPSGAIAQPHRDDPVLLATLDDRHGPSSARTKAERTLRRSPAAPPAVARSR